MARSNTSTQETQPTFLCVCPNAHSKCGSVVSGVMASSSAFARAKIDALALVNTALQPGYDQFAERCVFQNRVAELILQCGPLLEHVRPDFAHLQPVGFATTDAADAVGVLAPSIHARKTDA